MNTRPRRETYIVDSLQELPEDLQRRIKISGIDPEQAAQHFEVLLNILHFKTKQNFYTRESFALKNTQTVRRHNKGHSAVSNKIVSVDSLAEEQAALLSPWRKVDYKLHRQLGSGGFGTVFLATQVKNGRKVAIKRMPHKTTKQKRKNFQEIRFLMYNNGHPNILQYFQASVPDGTEMWLVTELVEGGTLTYAVAHHQFTEPQISFIVGELLNGLRFLHDSQLSHRDLKSANIMLGRGAAVKIIDFGLCTDTSQGEVVHMVGSPFWMPPEMIKRESHSLAVDIWSFGICCMEMANGHPPNRKSSIMAMFIACVEGYPEPFEEPNYWTDEFRDFIGCCLQRNPKDRWSVAQLQQHPFTNKRASKEAMDELFTEIFWSN